MKLEIIQIHIVHLPDISKEEKIEEIVTTGNKIKDLTGEDVNLFRPPFGNIDKETMRYL